MAGNKNPQQGEQEQQQKRGGLEAEANPEGPLSWMALPVRFFPHDLVTGGPSQTAPGSYPPQYSCLEHSMDGGAWQATVCVVAKSDRTKRRTHTHHRNNFLQSLKGTAPQSLSNRAAQKLKANMIPYIFCFYVTCSFLSGSMKTILFHLGRG